MALFYEIRKFLDGLCLALTLLGKSKWWPILHTFLDAFLGILPGLWNLRSSELLEMGFYFTLLHVERKLVGYVRNLLVLAVPFCLGNTTQWYFQMVLWWKLIRMSSLLCWGFSLTRSRRSDTLFSVSYISSVIVHFACYLLICCHIYFTPSPWHLLSQDPC